MTSESGTSSITTSQLEKYFKDGIIAVTAGTLSGTAHVFTGQPLDTVKVKMQTSSTMHKGWFSCLSETFKSKGVKGLYAGTIPALISNVTECVVLFAAYEASQKVVAYLSRKQHVNELSSLQNALSGSLAALFSTIFVCPSELVKCRLQAQQRSSSNLTKKITPISVCKQIWKKDGFGAFTAGMVPTLVREVPGTFLMFGIYELCRHSLTKKGQDKDDIGCLNTAISGAIGGIAYWTAVFPIDLIKSRMQVKGGTAKQVTMHVLKTQGIRGFYRGLTPTLIKAFIACPALFIVYESSTKALNSRLNGSVS